MARDHSMQLPINFFRERTANTIDLLQFLNARRAYAFKATKPRQKALTTFSADTGDLFKGRAGAGLAEFGAMTINREAMGLITNLLDQVQSSMIL